MSERRGVACLRRGVWHVCEEGCGISERRGVWHV